jgi:uncharacterized damage-inducible protein DinB
MSQVPVWYERKFTFTFPVEQYPNLCVRLRGTPARLDEMFRGVTSEKLVRKPAGKWSIQEHAGHLFDLESLWLKRVENFFEKDGDTLATTDLSNRQVDEANYNARTSAEILAQFRTARRKLSERLEGVPPESFALCRLHPRLKQPMRLVDHLYFVAEHDDHHLAKIWELIRS